MRAGTENLEEVVDGKECMKPTINHLIQLQELMEARAQHETLTGDPHLDQLNGSIASLLDKLPDDIRSRFERIQKKEHTAIVPIAGGVCSACGMQLPVSLVHSVRAADDLYTCPNCARMLFALPESQPKSLHTPRSSRTDAPRVGIARFSSPELMMPHIDAGTGDEALEQICSKMEEEEFVDKGGRLLEEAQRREAIMSTAVDHGLAFPHVRNVEGGGLALALATSDKGIKFDDSSRLLTRVFFFVAIPTAASAFYLKLLSGLTRAYQVKTARERLLKADTPAKLWKALIATTKKTIA